MSSKPTYSCSRRNWPTSSGEGPEVRNPVPEPQVTPPHFFFFFFESFIESVVIFASVLLRHWKEINSIVPALLEPNSNRAAPRASKPEQQARSILRRGHLSSVQRC